LSPIQFMVIYFAGLVAGFMNVIGGGGSMITLPVLMWIGLPAPIANGTNRIAILLQNAVGVRTFISSGVKPDRSILPAIFFASVGSILGSLFVTTIPRETLDRVIAIVLLLVVFSTLFIPRRKVSHSASLPVTAMIFAAVGFYGGFLQAGVGFFLIAAITYVFGYDLVKTNATKIIIVLTYTLFSVSIFASRGMIELLPGLSLAIGNMSGAFMAARLSVKKGSAFVKWILVAVVVINAIKYLFF